LQSACSIKKLFTAHDWKEQHTVAAKVLALVPVEKKIENVMWKLFLHWFKKKSKTL
jgi:hypothetical protein